MTKPQVAIIVPFYNVEKYLARCLDSILAQRFSAFELILVNDGSTDGSPRIAEDYAARDERVTVLHQENLGQGAARNAGLEASSAPFVCFVDSDDYLDETYVLRLHAALVMEDADIAICAYTVHMRSGIRYRSIFSLWLPERMEREEALAQIIRDLSIKSFCWNKMFRRQLFESPALRFRSMYFEDVVLMPQLFARAGAVVVLQDQLYHYCKRKGSLMASQPEKRIDHAQAALTEVRDFLIREGLYARHRKDFKFCAGHFALANGYVRVAVALGGREKRPLRKGLATYRTLTNLCVPLSEATIAAENSLATPRGPSPDVSRE